MLDAAGLVYRDEIDIPLTAVPGGLDSAYVFRVRATMSNGRVAYCGQPLFGCATISR
jgi:hypothetical protein